MPKYRIELRAQASVKAVVEVEAPTQKAAKAAVIAIADSADWRVLGVIHSCFGSQDTTFETPMILPELTV